MDNMTSASSVDDDARAAAIDKAIKESREASPGRDICKINVPDHDVVIIARIPNDPEYQAFRAGQSGEDGGTQRAIRTLVVSAVAKALENGAPVSFGDLLKRRPAIIDTAADKLLKAAGISRAATVEKI